MSQATSTIWVVMPKEWSAKLTQRKNHYFNRKCRLIRLFYFQKYRNFIGSRSCSNQTKLGMMYPLCRKNLVKEGFLGIACLGKRSVFHSEICELPDQQILKMGLFYWIKEQFKMKQFYIPDYQCYFGCNSKRMACLTKLMSQATSTIQVVMPKEWSAKLSQRKNHYFIWKYRLMRLYRQIC